MADQYHVQRPQLYGYYHHAPPNLPQLPPQKQTTYVPGEAQSYYDQNQLFGSNSYDDYYEDECNTKADEEDGDHNTNNQKCSKKDNRKRRSHGSSHSSTSTLCKPKVSLGQLAANVHQPNLKPGITGRIKGMFDLACKKSYVRGDTVERLELLRRADHFFNNGFIGRFGGLNKEKSGWFREEMDRVSMALRDSSKGDMDGNIREDKVEERRHIGYKLS